MYEPISCQNQAIIIRIRQELESGGGGHCLERGLKNGLAEEQHCKGIQS